jgi:hypothetical protein
MYPRHSSYFEKSVYEYNWRNNDEWNARFSYIQDSYVRSVRATSNMSRRDQQVEIQILTVEFSVDLGSG